jgi:pyruvate formate lyase activating enzyme
MSKATLSELTGKIFDIKRYAIHDGPGIRTTVFFKGCPLSCRWCHNPEGLQSAPRISYDSKRCIGCGECIQGCPEAAVTMTAAGIATDRHRCRGCGTCADLCPACARELTEKIVTPAQLMEIVKKDTIFYDASGGGVTFSGGEPLLQADFLIQVLDECGRLEIHRAVDTSGYSDQATLGAAAQRSELFLFDLKVIDGKRHKFLTGVSSKSILDNLKFLYDRGADITIRIPLIPGVNDDRDNIHQICEFLSGLPKIRNVHILPYHDIQKNKYTKLGMPYAAGDIAVPDSEKLAFTVSHLKSRGFQIGLGG